MAPPAPISGAAAFERCVAHTLPYLERSGGSRMFVGEGGPLLIGPAEERWDRVSWYARAARNPSWRSLRTLGV